jgi:IPT/TIG domain
VAGLAPRWLPTGGSCSVGPVLCLRTGPLPLAVEVTTALLLGALAASVHPGLVLAAACWLALCSVPLAFIDDSIGRITTTGTVTSYTLGSGIFDPEGITAGPDGALWFTNYIDADVGNSIGLITTAVTPAISGFTPAAGAAGTTVTITGQNLSGATKVAFDGTPATIVSGTATQIVTKVPSGTATSPITVTTPAGTATSHTCFTVT